MISSVGELRDRRVVIFGASKGIGRGVAERLHREGADLVVAARSLELLEELVAGCDGRPTALACDVCDEDGVRATVAQAAETLGGLDALVYAVGMGVVTSLRKATRDHWLSAFDTNVVGANIVTAAAVPHLSASRGAAIYFSSVSAQLTPPWKGMGVYLASKKALEKCVEAWTLEEPLVRFTTVVVGSTSGGHFFDDAIVVDPGDLAMFQREWHLRGYLATEQLRPDDQAQTVVDVLSSRAQIDTVWVRPRSIMQLPEETTQ